ncbi:hypothetical protein RINTHM_7850 [Richelia intracellularis HM01]|nr:hypothetical protein RINTHM_7850 [Richelia intracellularis HM01]
MANKIHTLNIVRKITGSQCLNTSHSLAKKYQSIYYGENLKSR